MGLRPQKRQRDGVPGLNYGFEDADVIPLESRGVRQQLSFIIMTTPHPSYMYFDAPSLTPPATACVDLVH